MAAVGSIVETAQMHRVVKYLTLAWTSDAATGAVSGIPSTTVIDGEILRVTTAPGSPAPDDLYDLTLIDQDGADVLAGKGANRSSTLTQTLVPLTGDGTTTNQRFYCGSTVTLTVANANNSKKGSITIYWR